MSGRHPRTAKVPITYFPQRLAPKKTQALAPAPEAHPSTLDPVIETSPSPHTTPAPATPPARVSTIPFPLLMALGSPGMAPYSPGITPHNAFAVPPAPTEEQAADAVDPSRSAPEIPWLYGPFSMPEITWLASSELTSKRVENEGIGRKAKKLAASKHNHFPPSFLFLCQQRILSYLGIEDSGVEIERESEGEAEPEGRRESGKGVRKISVLDFNGSKEKEEKNLEQKFPFVSSLRCPAKSAEIKPGGSSDWNKSAVYSLSE